MEQEKKVKTEPEKSAEPERFADLGTMQAIVARNPFANYIGMELLEVMAGFAKARIRLKPQYENVYGGMHGGCAYALADTLAGVAACTYGDSVTTLGASMNYMRPVIDTEYLYCEARVLRNGGRVSVVRTELQNDGGERLIEGSFTYYHLGKGYPLDNG